MFAVIVDRFFLSAQRTLCKNMRQEVQELEKANLDPTTAVQNVSRKK